MRSNSLLVVFALAMAALALVPVASGATVQNQSCQGVLTDERNATAGPGGELAEAIGNQGSEIGSRLNDEWFDATLANATTDQERASIIAAEVDRIQTRFVTVRQCWSAHERGDQKLRPRAIEVLRGQALTLHRRVNETEVESARLPRQLRQRNDIGDGRLDELERQIVSLRAAMTPEGAETPVYRD